MPSASEELQRSDEMTMDTGKAGPTELQVRVLHTWEELSHIRRQWNDVLRASSLPRIYLTYEWLQTWWKCFGGGLRTLFVMTVCEDGELIGIAPCVKVKTPELGIPTTKIEFLSMRGHAFSALNCAGQLEFIASRRHEDVIVAVFGELLRRRREWMFLRLHPLPATSLTLSTLLHLAEAGHFHVRHSKVFESAVILRGNEGWKEYQKRRSHRGFGRVERLLGKLNQEGAISLEEHRQLDNGVTFDDLLDVERRSWKARWGFRMDSRAYRGFFRRAAEAIASKGWLVVSVLRLNGRVIAFDVAADFEGNVEDLKMSYDAAYRRYSPGNNVKIFMLKRRMEEGANRISFGWGITPGKERWMDTLEDHHELFIFRAGFLGRLLFFLYLQTPVYKVLSRLWRFKNDILRRHHVY